MDRDAGCCVRRWRAPAGALSHLAWHAGAPVGAASPSPVYAHLGWHNLVRVWDSQRALAWSHEHNVATALTHDRLSCIRLKSHGSHEHDVVTTLTRMLPARALEGLSHLLA